MPVSSDATSAARREALFVAYAIVVASARSLSTASAAPGIGLSIRNTTPSRSKMTRS
jgi:hypothetical protein